MKARAKVDAERLKILTAEFVRRGKNFYKGLLFDVSKVPGGRRQLDTKAIAVEMGDAWINARKTFMGWFEWSVIRKPIDEVEPEPAPKPAPKPTRSKAKARVLADA
ncbi:hypothetical protein [Lichenihabitans psoromatis]|uniref:hypothetical protein n=1 Tax=Lichenihabitans psoromatis TaxID=2528642 RepID=UPI0010360BAE|nr:hypothetical protein [Lichenihabitans psoromatis]